ncbi:MAG TPA: isoprenyl transferase [Phycisphaerales bacterium]|nr:isoprenyl transferase [Phycisphaerales bacterium]
MPDVHPERIPRHVAVIMDGNGRWATERGQPRMMGHREGAKSVRRLIKAAGRLGIEYITLYSFSTENWKRPAEEVEALMSLCVAYCRSEMDELISNGIRVRVIGRREGLSDEVISALHQVEEATNRASSSGPTLCLAINYGAREELLDMVRAVARDAQAGTLDPDSISGSDLEDRLYTTGMPDPDLLIRTAGEYRVSNFLLWQISYAELYVTSTLWPDFDEHALHDAIRSYAGRERRFGGLGGV